MGKMFLSPIGFLNVTENNVIKHSFHSVKVKPLKPRTADSYVLVVSKPTQTDFFHQTSSGRNVSVWMDE